MLMILILFIFAFLNYCGLPVEIHLEKKHDFFTAYLRIRASSSEIHLERDTLKKFQGILQLLRQLHKWAYIDVQHPNIHT